MLSEKGNFIILRKTKYSESDLVIQALSAQGAKFSFIAKGALRSKKRFSGGVLEPTHFATFSYKMKGDSNAEDRLIFLEEAKLINGFSGLREDYDRLQVALYIVSLVDKVSLQGSVDSGEVFNLLGNTLKQLEISDMPHLLKCHFEVKLLYQQGVLPQDLLINSFLVHSIKDHKIAGEELGFPDSQQFQTIKTRLQYAVSQYMTEATTY